MRSDLAERALAWRRDQFASVCDVIAPWAHGRVVRATRYPNFYEYNAVVVSEPTGLEAEGLAAVADSHLADFAHRCIEFEIDAEAERLIPGFQHLGWKTTRLVTMRFEGSPPSGGEVEVREVEFDAVHALRVAWHAEDFPGIDATAYHGEARAVRLARGARVLAAFAEGRPIGFAEVEQIGDGMEIDSVYVLPQWRGRGAGTAVTAAAVRWALKQAPRDLWIVADALGRPQHLYARLGFVPVWRWGDTLRVPQA